MSYVIALDEGTTSTRAVLYNTQSQKIEKIKSIHIRQYYPLPSYVEESASEIYSSSLAALVEIIDGTGAKNISGIGITNQRETVVAWSKSTGKPLYNAIIWQCRRTADYCKKIENEYGEIIRQKTGLKVDPYFSASKMRWLLDNVPEVKSASEKDDLCFGTIETFLIFKLTGGKKFVTDYTNASRTMLYNINTNQWDDELLKIFGIPRSSLARVVSPDSIVGEFEYGNQKIKIAGIAGDQQSAAIGQGCFGCGSLKITYGTGMFMLANIGKQFKLSQNGLLTTLGYGENGPTYMFEGSVFNAGSAIQWLRDGLDFFERSSESEKLALSVSDNGGVYVVPAFTGLGAPYWVSDATGIISGITRSTGKGHITRAVLESMAYSARDIIEVCEEDSNTVFNEIRVDGGASQNNFLMQFQANVLGCTVDRPVERESTALGAAYLCLIAIGEKTLSQVKSLRVSEKCFYPESDTTVYEKYYGEWKKAVERCIYDKK